MSWLGTVSEGDGYVRSVNRISRSITLISGTGGGTGTTGLQPLETEVIQYAMATTWYYGGMSETAASAWLGTLGSVTPKYSELTVDRVDDSGQYAVTAMLLGTWGA